VCVCVCRRDREVWRDFHKMVDKCTGVRDLCERLVWASQNLLQRMMKSKWNARRKQWCVLRPPPSFTPSHRTFTPAACLAACLLSRSPLLFPPGVSVMPRFRMMHMCLTLRHALVFFACLSCPTPFVSQGQRLPQQPEYCRFQVALPRVPLAR
jgi:hypothetical protein